MDNFLLLSYVSTILTPDSENRRQQAQESADKSIGYIPKKKCHKADGHLIPWPFSSVSLSSTHTESSSYTDETSEKYLRFGVYVWQ